MTKVNKYNYQYAFFILCDLKVNYDELKLVIVQGEQYVYKGDSNYIDKQAVSNSNVITANGTAALEFAKEIMLYLKIKPADEINKWYEFHKHGMYQK